MTAVQRRGYCGGDIMSERTGQDRELPEGSMYALSPRERLWWWGWGVPIVPRPEAAPAIRRCSPGSSIRYPIYDKR